MTPEQRRLRASAAAHAQWARCPDRAARLRAAHQGLERRIAREYGIPDNLPPAEYAIRLESARRAYYTAMALRSSMKRAKRKAGK